MPYLWLPECLVLPRCPAPAAWQQRQTASIISGAAPSPPLWWILCGLGSPPLPPLRPTHIWLARPPEGSGVLADVWDVVCVAAVAAMDLGRRMATRGQLSSAEASVVVSPGAAEDLAARAAAAAGTWFWAALQDMCSAGAVPQAWRDLPATACPFFVRRPSDDSWAVPPFSAAA